jgi:2-hydroxychromene-2-carboxylate isomerase
VIIASLLFDNDLEKTFALTKDLCEAVWVEDLDVSDENVIKKICEKLDLKESTKNLYNKDEKVIEVLKNNTSDAKKNNVFGVPTFLYKNELFFGQDRMFMLEQAIKTNA